jgi:hypothetical protein
MTASVMSIVISVRAGIEAGSSRFLDQKMALAVRTDTHGWLTVLSSIVA